MMQKSRGSQYQYDGTNFLLVLCSRHAVRDMVIRLPFTIYPYYLLLFLDIGMCLLGIWLSITLLTFISISTFILNIFIISRQCDMSRNGTSAIYESLYYSELLCEACH